MDPNIGAGMPRVSREVTARNRAEIERVSARLFREQGLQGVSVADLMAAAGLTHGGFYGHFESKDALATVACTKAFDEAVERWEARISGTTDPKSALTALVDGYLSSRNRRSAGSGCPLAGLATDVAREPDGKPVKDAYLAGLRRLIGVLVALQSTDDPKQDRGVALARLSTMVGAMVLARATNGHALSNEIMAAARENILGGIA
jgi:TetR/AcrR family transcriptional regulator, transcriptional repressor for nem operon